MPTQTHRLPTIRQTIKGQKNGLMPFFYALNVLREVVNKLRRSQVFLVRCIQKVQHIAETAFACRQILPNTKQYAKRFCNAQVISKAKKTTNAIFCR